MKFVKQTRQRSGFVAASFELLALVLTPSLQSFRMSRDTGHVNVNVKTPGSSSTVRHYMTTKMMITPRKETNCEDKESLLKQKYNSEARTAFMELILRP